MIEKPQINEVVGEQAVLQVELIETTKSLLVTASAEVEHGNVREREYV